jgi:ketosteroid isomerase-like protein
VSDENVELVKRFARGFETDGIEVLREYCDPEIEWHEDPAFPEAGVYRGREAVARYGEQFFSEFSEIHYEVGDAFSAGEHVIANMEINGVGRTSGAAFELSAWWASTIRNGKIVRLYAYLDRDRALEAVGLAK